MAQIKTRAQMRDTFWRNIGMVPAVDAGGNSGDPPNGVYSPTSLQINELLDTAISWINTDCRFRSAHETIAIPAQAPAFLGPYTVRMERLVGSGNTLSQQVMGIRRLVWDDGTGNPVRLIPRDYHQMDRGGYGGDTNWQTTGVSQPAYYWMDGYGVSIWPAPSVAGNLDVIETAAAANFANDNDRVDQLQSDFQVAITDYATFLYCGNQTGDSEAAQRQVSYSLRCFGNPQTMTKGWQQKLAEYAENLSEEFLPGFGLSACYRRGRSYARRY